MAVIAHDMCQEVIVYRLQPDGGTQTSGASIKDIMGSCSENNQCLSIKPVHS
ncbi:hypothetical protein [Bacillus atrophaeus]|uniref:hypothetical protein n=1 Tax=Bacillus atrophaeus TaxID=1452 RepID=UPI003F595E4C